MLPLLVRMHYSLYPDGWYMVIHTDDVGDKFTYMNVLRTLQEDGLVTIIDSSKETVFDRQAKCLSMLWRMLPIWSGKYKYVFCRDLDSLLTPRMTKYVLSFIKSGKSVHGINDNDCHNIPLMGGMVGFRSEGFLSLIGGSSFRSIIDRAGFSIDSWDNHGCDQDFLMKVLWPLVSHDSLIHSIQGQNERYIYRDCCGDIDISWMDKYLQEYGDELTNYMGAACSINSPFGGKLDDRIKYAISVYDEHGSRKTTDGIIELRFPDVLFIAKKMIDCSSYEDWESLNRKLYGGQGDNITNGEGMYHYTGFTFLYLRDHMEKNHGMIYVKHKFNEFNCFLTIKRGV